MTANTNEDYTTDPADLVTLSRTGFGTVKPAEGHDEHCYGSGCEECKVHTWTCVCPYCVVYNLEHPEESPVLQGGDDYKRVRECMRNTNQLDLAQTFAHMHLGQYAYDRDGIWREWDWMKWKPETLLTFSIGQHVRAMLGMDATATEEKAWLNLATFRAVAELAQHYLTAEWDTQPLIGMPDGAALNTTTGRIVVNDLNHYISRYLPDTISTDSNEPSKRWRDFVLESLSHYGDSDKLAIHDYLQQYVGSALSGDCRDEAMVFLYGPPGTGKSTFAETLLQCFGEYGATIAGERVAKEHSQHLQWLAGLRGKRLVVITELPERGKWQTSVMDQLISGEMIEANRMRADSINFRSQAHILATGNHRPSAKASAGIWRRLRIIQFQNVPDKPDKGLKAEFQGELPFIFNWALDGLRNWIANGRQLVTPYVLTAETGDYKASADPVHQFAKEHLRLTPDGVVTVDELYGVLLNWWILNVSEKPISKRRFGEALDDLGYPKSTSGMGGKVRVREGLAIRDMTQ